MSKHSINPFLLLLVCLGLMSALFPPAAFSADFSLDSRPSETSEFKVAVEGPLPVVYVCIKTDATGEKRFESPEVSDIDGGYRWVFTLPPIKADPLTILFVAKDPYAPADVSKRPDRIYVSKKFSSGTTGIRQLEEKLEKIRSKRSGGALGNYPRPENDNGRGIHWFPTTSQDPAEVDKFIEIIKQMKIKWVLFLNGSSDADSNKYLVKKLADNRIMPVMRLYYDAIRPATSEELESLKKVVAGFKTIGVHYFQIFNEPNLECEWENKKFPENSVSLFASAFIPRAKAVLAAGGIPGIPGPAPGYVDVDGKIKSGTFYFKMMMDEIVRREGTAFASKCFVAIHNYATSQDPHVENESGFWEFKAYRKILEGAGINVPLIGGEGGTRPEDVGGDLEKMADWNAFSYKYMKNAPDYFFCFTPWLLTAPEGNDWTAHAWIKPDGRRLPVVRKVIDLE